MGRFARSWEVAKQSWRVMRSNPSLAMFPVISGIVSLIVTGTFIAPIVMSLYASGYFNQAHSRSEAMPPAYYVVMFCYYLVSYFVVVFFNVGLVHCANQALNGQPTSFGDGIRAASKRLGPIMGWALVGATVGMILRTLSERSGLIGQIVIGIIGGAWNIVTFFVVPTLAIEGIGPIAAIKTSFNTLKKTWGESIIGNIGIGSAVGLLALIPIPIFIGACFTGSPWVIFPVLGLCILFWIGLGIVSSCLTGIYTTALYSYAKTGQIPGGFSQEQIQLAFVPKPAGRFSRKGR